MIKVRGYLVFEYSNFKEYYVIDFLKIDFNVIKLKIFLFFKS